MTPITDRDIELMDKILLLRIENDWRKTIPEELNIPEDECQFLIDRIIEFNNTHFKIVDPMDEGTTYQSIDHCFETKRFVDNGGFRQFFDKQKTPTSSPTMEDTIKIILTELQDNNGQQLADILSKHKIELTDEQTATLLTKMNKFIMVKNGYKPLIRKTVINELTIIPDGEKWLDKQELQPKTNINLHIGDNFGNYNQSSNSSNSPQTIKITPQNISKLRKKNIALQLWTLISDNKLISGIILLLFGYLLTHFILKNK